MMSGSGGNSTGRSRERVWSRRSGGPRAPTRTARFRLRGLEADARYIVTDLDDPERPRQFPGRELMDRGLPITLPDRRSSAILIYVRPGEAK